MAWAAPSIAVPRIPTLDLYPALDRSARVVTLEQLLGSSERLPLALALHLGAELAQRVATIHGAGRAVGALDAERVRVSVDGQVSLTRTGGGRLAPELVDGGSGTPQSDIYAVAFLIHQLVTGVAPSFARPVAPSLLNAQLDAELDAVILSALRPVPEQRPAAVLALQAALEGLAEELGLTADPRALGQRVERVLAAQPASRVTLPPMPAAEAWFANPGPLPRPVEDLDAERTERAEPGWSPKLLIGSATLAGLAMLFTLLVSFRPSAAPEPQPGPAPVVEARPARVEPPARVELPPPTPEPVRAAVQAPVSVNEPAPQPSKVAAKRVKPPRRHH